MNLSGVQLDRAAGALVGLAAGDALGAGYEFTPAPPTPPAMIGGGLGDWNPGEWTDDTQMAICLAEVAASGTLDPASVAERFLAWYRSGPADVGVQTASVLRGARHAGELTALAREYFDAHPHNSAGNGSLMRTAPVALAHLGDDEAMAASARAISRLTHGDPLAGEACILWCVAIDRAIRHGHLDGVRDGLDLLPADRRGFWGARLDDAESAPLRSFSPNGFVVTALQAAHAAISRTPVPTGQSCRHLREALGAAVSIGHDTDTVAAIAGSLLGARWGASAVPLAWRSILHGWPGYRAADLVRLAVLSARSGHDDAAGWPSGPSLLSYYDTHFHPDGVTAALDDDQGVSVGDVGGLLKLPTGTDVVVSLCRVGREDVPAGVEGHGIWLMDHPDPEENPNLDFIFSDLADQMCAWRMAGRRVFVHCVRTESRTPAVAAGYLAQRLGVSGREALERVRRTLPRAAPNARFVAALDHLWPERAKA